MNKILLCGVFNPDLIYTASPYCGDEIFATGFEKNDLEVYRFDYRASKSPNEELLTVANDVKPDLFYFGKAERIYAETIKVLKQRFPNAIFIKFAADVRDNPTDFDLSHLQFMDLFAATYAGEYLQKHKKVMPKSSIAMSILAFTDSSFYKPISYPLSYKSDILWTGRSGFGDNLLRNEVIKRLYEIKEKHNVSMYGVNGNCWIGYPDYLHAICGTKIGIGSNSFNRRKYSSDRLGNYMACGTFYLTQYISGIEECFSRGVDIDWFESIEEMEDKIEYYLENEKIRKEIAKNGRRLILKYFDCKPLVENILYTLKNRKSQYKWDEVY